MVIRAWMRMLRLPNLALIACTQWLVYLAIMQPVLAEDAGASTLSFWTLVIATLLVCASGNVINNIFDRDLDAADPRLALIPVHFSLRQSWWLYGLLVVLGAAWTGWIAWSNGYVHSWWLYPAACGLLFSYSAKLKCTPLAGNLLVAAMTMAVIGIIPYAYWDPLEALRQNDPSYWATLIYKLIMLFLFAGVTNLAREVIKDLEDMDTDRVAGCASTAAYFGASTGKAFGLMIWSAVIIMAASALWFLSSAASVWLAL
ncbi:MAG TPA: UbiA family prenyltransferase, partial [Saprospiraceae bacterium]|nr:UbiA family prenyltransferase [Saprospiraceae bacterium]